jgi:hypothetical protein
MSSVNTNEVFGEEIPGQVDVQQEIAVPDVSGDAVRVQLNFKGILSLAEVQVFGVER